ncbi:MAG: transglycosylase domain-containing protein [Bacillota bacterium]|nr:transglycosylase domain-containing protein [Bacillota bacterium]
MSDNKNPRNRDDEFFAKFDDITDTHKNKVPTERSDDNEFYYGSSKDYRGKTEVKANRSKRNAKKKSRSPKKEKAPKAAKPKSEKAGKLKSMGSKTMAKTNSVTDAALKSIHVKPVRNKKPETTLRKVINTIWILGFVCVLAVGLFVGFLFLKAPAIDTDNIYAQINQRSVMYDTKGKEIENLYFSDGNRSIIQYKDIPENMVNAIVSLEDQKFWKHNGFNFIRMVGAIKESVFGGGEISGTSTVTQQLARNVYLSEIKSQRSLTRKISEMYCTIVLEKDLTKEQIMEAYLNTIYLGFNSYGVETAAQSYFSKSAEELSLEECAALAALPQSPDTYALVYSDYYNTNTSLPVIKKTPSVTYLYNGDLTKDRRDMVINKMYEGFTAKDRKTGKLKKEHITKEERDAALAVDLKDDIKIGTGADASTSSYFTDYALEQLKDQIVSEYGCSESEAETMIYTKGLKIYTTMDSRVQKIMEEEFKDNDNYTSISYANTNADNDIVGDNGVILARSYGNYFNGKDQFFLKSGDYKMNDDGSMTLYKSKRLNFYEIEVGGSPDISVEFKGMYKKNADGILYFIESGALSIPQGYKSLTDKGNCKISAQFFTDYPEFFKKGSDGQMLVNDENYTLKQEVRQPQAAAVIMENATGEIKAMMGGRGATGKQLYNRAVNPRQPGSSIKPIAVYGPAIQMGYEYHEEKETMNLDTSEGSNWGKYLTAGSVINDGRQGTVKVDGKDWPVNDDHGYHGDVTMREAVQKSLNVCSYKTFRQIERNEGAEYSMNMLKKVGITTLDDENDLNPAALSLGGLTNGISPLEETAAYATFPNGGVYKSPIFYTKVLDTNDDIIFEQQAEETQVYDKGVAWIMTDVLRTVVTNGIAGGAAISSQPVGGKTGTTSNKYDIWFSGFTPQYTMALWMGNDINMTVSDYSYKSAQFWSAIMGRVCADLPRANFFDKPSNVISVGGEYYIDGTYSKTGKRKHTKDKTDESSSSSSSSAEPSSSETSPTTPSSSETSPTSPTSPTQHSDTPSQSSSE